MRLKRKIDAYSHQAAFNHIILSALNRNFLRNGRVRGKTIGRVRVKGDFSMVDVFHPGIRIFLTWEFRLTRLGYLKKPLKLRTYFSMSKQERISRVKSLYQ